MKKFTFFIDVYNQFMYHITWTKLDKLQSYTLMIFFSIIIISLILYGVDKFFIWILKQLFSLNFF